LHVLLVDDRPSHVDSLGVRLQRNGYRTSLAPNRLEALAAARSDPPDVAVLDISSPEPDGFETCKALKQLLPRLPVIIYAAAKIANDRSLADACGADEIIEAPADRALVLQRIVQLLAR
jgi:two-component system OmpR family response regulator